VSRSKRKRWYEIQTTVELEEQVLFTDNIRIEGAFIRFTPYKLIVNATSYKQTGMELVLPERCIKQIVLRKLPEH